MEIERKLIDAILDRFNSPYLFDEGLYCPMQIILESCKIRLYREYVVLKYILVDNLSTSYVAELYGAKEDNIAACVTTMMTQLENSFNSLRTRLPKKKNELVDDLEIATICKEVGFPIRWLGDYPIEVLKLKSIVEQVLHGRGIDNLYSLSKAIEKSSTGLGEMSLSIVSKSLKDFINKEK